MRERIWIMALLAFCSCMHSAGNAEDQAGMARTAPRWRLIMNWDSGPVYGMPNWETDGGRFRAGAVDPFVGIGADAVCLSMSTTDLMLQDSKYSEYPGQYDDEYSLKALTDEDWRGRKEHVERMIAEKRFQLTVLLEQGRKAGLDVLASFRMNDTHDLYYSKEGPRAGVPVARFKREHPELLIKDNQGWTKFCLDYAHEAVRERRYNQIAEVVERFDVDGVELDFMRNGFFFAKGAERRNAPLMTDLVKRIRALLDEYARKRGRRLFLAVHTPVTQEVALDCGLDVTGWIEQGIVDCVVADEGCTPFSVMPADFVQAAKKAGKCLVFSTLDLGFGLPERPEPEKGCNCPGKHWTPAQLRGWAVLQREAGVDGLNFFNGHYSAADRENLTKVFGPGKGWWDFTGMDKTFVAQNISFCANMPRKAVPKIEMLPKTLAPGKEQGIDILVPLAIGPEEKASLESVTLRLIFRGLSSEDQLEVRLGQVSLGRSGSGAGPLPRMQLAERDGMKEITFALDPGMLSPGRNTVTVLLHLRPPAPSPPLTWNAAELQFHYHAPH